MISKAVPETRCMSATQPGAPVGARGAICGEARLASGWPPITRADARRVPWLLPISRRTPAGKHVERNTRHNWPRTCALLRQFLQRLRVSRPGPTALWFICFHRHTHRLQTGRESITWLPIICHWSLPCVVGQDDRICAIPLNHLWADGARRRAREAGEGNGNAREPR